MSEASQRNGLLREPLLHFLIIGAFVFGLHSLWSAQKNTSDRTIEISSTQLQRLSTIWASEAGRDPTPDDIKSLIAEYVREEVLYREALRLGLNRDDTIIRRRLAQKMEFVIGQTEPPAILSLEELRAAYHDNVELYADPPRISFQHVPFNFAPDGQNRQADMEMALEQLRRDGEAADWTKLGDPFLLSRTHEALSETEVARLFGRDFAAKLFTLQTASGWGGPHRSRLAWHLVNVKMLDAGGVPAFEDIVETVRTREADRREREANQAAMGELLDRYIVKLNTDPS